VLAENRELFETIFAQTGSPPPGLGLTQAEIFGLFRLRTPRGPLPAVA